MIVYDLAQIHYMMPILRQNWHIQYIIIGIKVMINQQIYQEQAFKTLDVLQKIVEKVDFNVSILENLASQKQASHKQALKGWVNPRQDPRFAILEYPLGGEVRTKDDMTVWCGLMAKEVFEHTFMLFQKGDLDEDEAKCLATSNFLHNFLRLSERVNLKKEDVGELDTKLKDQILPYLLKKYPQSKNKQVNIKLSQKIQKKKIDNRESNQNDLIWRSEVKFKLSEKKQYDQSIMEFLNYVIQVSNSNKGRMNHIQEQYQKKKQKLIFCMKEKEKKDSEATFYQDFHQYFQSLFEQIYKKSGKEKQKVKEYTKYYINRKISPNTKTFSEEEIKEGYLTLKNSALMRVVTKWCKELRNNFEKPDTTAHKHDQFRMVDGSQRYLSHEQAEQLEIILQKKNYLIKKWLSKVQQNNWFHQQQFAQKKYTDAKDKMLSENESSVGMFAAVNNQNYEFYLICYLKELIHHCLSAMEQFEYLCLFKLDNPSEKVTKENIDECIKDAKGKNKFNQVPNNDKDKDKDKMNSKVINLITFKIGDLFRCKYSSKQQEINILYNKLHLISEDRPDILKIVRIQNRLQQGTKDVLLNLLFQEKLLIEIQLAIDTGQNKFMECSDKFNHFIYEVKRAEFGPISELCSIWMNKDLRADFFRKRFEEAYQGGKEQDKEKKDKEKKDKEEKDKEEKDKEEKDKEKKDKEKKDKEEKDKEGKEQINFPFLCSCSRYVINPHQISSSDKKQCIHCIIGKFQEYEEIKKINEILKQLPDVNGEKVQRKKYTKNTFPEMGLVFDLKTRQNQIYIFKCFKKGKKKYLIKKENKKFICIGEVTTNEQQKLFFENHLVFCHPSFQEKANQLQEQQVQKDYFIPLIFDKMKRDQKQSIRIMGEGLNDVQIKEEPFNFVKKANLSENNFKNINSIAKKFPKAKKLILNNNKFPQVDMEQNLEELQQFQLNDSQIKTISENTFKKIKGVEILSMASNEIKNLPSSFQKLANLKSLYLSWNPLTSLPSLEKLTSLQHLDLSYTQLKSLPSLEKLTKLHHMDLRSNRLTSLPSLEKLTNLHHLYLSSNQLKSLPSLEKLTNLHYLYLSSNQLKSLPSLEKLTKLHHMDLRSNRLTSLPSLEKLTNLHHMDLRSNRLTSLPSLEKLTKLHHLYLSSNRLTSPPSLEKLTNLQHLYLSSNRLTSPPSLEKLTNLQHLYLIDTQLQSPPSLEKLAKLHHLDLSSNRLKSLPSFQQLSISTLYLNNNEFESFPNSIEELKHIQKLYLRENNFENLPQFVTKLPKLRQLSLDEDKMNERSRQIIEQLINRGIRMVRPLEDSDSDY